MTTGNARIRLAVVLSHPTQYYSPWFRWLAARAPLDIRVFYLWSFGVTAQRDRHFGTTLRWDVDLLSGYENEFVPNVAGDPGTHHFFGLRNPGLPARLAAFRPDALLLFGYKWMGPLRAAAWARMRGVPIVFRGDSHFLGRRPAAAARTIPLRWLYRHFAAFAYVGTANRAYFEALGVPPRKLFFSPHAVDNGLFDPGNPAHRSAAEALRAQLGLLPETRVVLFAGKLVPAKQPRELLQAFLDLRPVRTALVIAGEGEEKEALLEMARRAAPGTVHFLPFANQTEMPARYLLADLFVLPSRGLYETWGLAVNESMRMGVPCLVSDRVGCQTDLIEPDRTGWVFESERPGHLASSLGKALAVLEDPEARAGMRRAAVDRISGFSYARATEGLLEALGAVRAGPRPFAP